MATVSGTVESKSRDGKSIKLNNGEWYGSYRPESIANVNRGDTVTLDYVEKVVGGKIYKNISSAAVPSPGIGTPINPQLGGIISQTIPAKPGEPFIHRDLTIIRQNAANVASRIVAASIQVSGKPPTKEDITHMLDYIMNHVADFSSGESDVRAAKEELAKTE